MHSKLIRNLLIVASLALSIANLAAADADSQVVRRFGLFIGANDGGPEREKLQWAISDAQRMNQVMTELGGMLPGDSMVVNDPKLVDIQQAIAKLRLQVAGASGDARRVEFMFYYSGHSDEEGLLIGKDKLAYKTLRQSITEVKADVTIAVLDSCASGAFTRQKGGVRVQPFLVDASNDMKGYAFLTSASENEAAQESDRLGASFFTHYLVSALRGAASTNGSGRVTLNEAYAYAFNETLARTEATSSGPQHPSYDISLSGTGDLVLSDLSQPSASIMLKDDLEGRVFVRDQKGYLVVEVNKILGKNTTLALQPGSYTLRIESPAGVYQAPAKLGLRQQYAIGMANFQKSQVAATRSRGNTPAKPAPDPVQSTRIEGLPTPSDLGMDNVLEQARARYRRATLNEAPAAGIEEPAADQPLGQAEEPDEPASATVQATIQVDIEGIGTWEIVTPVLVAPLVTPPVVITPGKVEKETKPAKTKAPAETPIPSTDPENVFFHFGFVPGVGTTGRRPVISTFTLSPLIASVAGNNGVMGSLFINLNSGHENGWQVSTLFNSANSLQGVQTSVFGNLVKTDSSGVQLATLFDLAQGSFVGWQSSALFNITNGSMSGLQASALFNFSGAKMAGMQGAGLFNISKGGVQGLQAASLFNVAADVTEGVQLAGLFNSAKGFSGIQAAGVLNVATDAHGVVIAPINIMGKFDGLPIGLINIVGDGIHDISYWFGTGDRTWIGFLNGSKNFYSIGFVGTRNFGDVGTLDSLAYGLGVGGRIHFIKQLYLDIEGSLKGGSRGSTAAERIASMFDGSMVRPDAANLVPAVRLNAGVDLGFIKGFVGFNADLFFRGLAKPAEYLTSDGLATLVEVAPTQFSFRPGVNIGVALSF